MRVTTQAVPTAHATPREDIATARVDVDAPNAAGSSHVVAATAHGAGRAARLEVATRRRRIAFWVVLAVYAVVTVMIMVPSPLLDLDNAIYLTHLRAHYPQFNRFALDYVMFGQRAPATLAFLPYFIWVAWRTRSTRPLVMLATSLVLLNVSVGVVKLLTGRPGPRQTHLVHDVLVGGDIYPSGHVSNAVVLYGLIAMIALRHRKLAIGFAVFITATVSFGTIYLNTHWFSDLVGGWLAGGLVLLALPWVLPSAQRWTDLVVARAATAYRRLRRAVQARARTRPARGPVRPIVIGPRHRPGSTPVSSTARAHNLVATGASREGRDDPTR